MAQGTSHLSSATDSVDTELPAAAALADGASATPTTPTVGTIGLVQNASTMDVQRAVVNGQNTVGTGITAAGIVAQLDDVSTGSVTENQFAPVRLSSRRALLVEGVTCGTNINVCISGTPTVAICGTPGVCITNSPLSVAQSGTWNITQITGPISTGTSQSNLGKADGGSRNSGDVGVVTFSVKEATPTTLVSVDGLYGPTEFDGKGRLYTKDRATNTSTLTNVASSATTVSVLAANNARITATFYNDSTQICYLKLGTTASATSYTVQLAANAYYELPCPYTGSIDALWASANGNLRVTELT